ncbi:MAG: hypothetical protein ACI9KE_001902 [Polyangiales bacterium]|jgi:hypothetical protein
MRILAREARALRRGVAIAAMVRGSCVEQPRDLEAYLVRGGVAGLCARQLGARQLGAACHSPLVLALRRARLIQAAMNEHLRRQMCEVFATLEHDGLEPIVVKGWSIARHYDAPGLRPYTDVDVFVSAAALPRARQLLRERPDAGALAVDLHGCLKGGRLPHDELRRHTELVLCGGRPIRVLRPATQLALLALHSTKHGHSRPIWVYDLHRLGSLGVRMSDVEYPLSRQEREYVGRSCELANALFCADPSPITDRYKRQVLRAWGDESALQESIYVVQRAPKNWGRALRSRWPNRWAAAYANDVSLDVRWPIECITFASRCRSYAYSWAAQRQKRRHLGVDARRT